MEEGQGLNVIRERWDSLAKEQKISVGILSVCGLIALVLSAQRIHSSIFDPFTVSTSKFQGAKEVVNSIDSARVKDEEAKRRDTDGDTISDYDEERVYSTSPYLADTDGDGIPDNVEIANGTNPNCAVGKTCASQLDVSSLSTSTGLMGVFGADAAAPSGDQLYAQFQRGINDKKQEIVDQTGSTSTILKQDLVRDPVEIRKVLQNSGKISQATIDALTDEQLLRIYDQALAQLAGTGLPSDATVSPDQAP